MATDPSTNSAVSPGDKLFARAVRLDLSGSELALRGSETETGAASPVPSAIELDRLELHARPVRYLNAPLQFEISAESVRIAPGIPSGKAPFSVHWNDGRLMLEISPAHIESLLLQMLNVALAPHETTITHVGIRFQAAGRKELDFNLECRGKRGWVAATLEGTGRLAIDEQLTSRLTDLKLEGRGVVGALVAAILRRRLDDIADKPISLGRPLWGVLQFTDVAFELDERVRVIGQFGPPGVVTPSPPSDSGGSTPLPLENPESIATSADLTPSAGLPRYDVYLVDTGINAEIRKNFDTLRPSLERLTVLGPVQELSPDQSTQIVNNNPQLASGGPIVLLLPRNESTGPGYRLSLGTGEGNPLATLVRLVELLEQNRQSHATDVVKRELALGNLPGVFEVAHEGRAT